MGKGYITSKVSSLVAVRDRERLRNRGWVATHDYVWESNLLIVSEVDEDTMRSRPVGLVTDREHVRHVVSRHDTEYVKRNTLVRVKDLMDVKQMSWRTGRSKSTIVGTWLKWPDFPPHVGTWGGSKVWYWPDVVACLERHGVTVRREVANGGSNGQDEGATDGTKEEAPASTQAP